MKINIENLKDLISELIQYCEHNTLKMEECIGATKDGKIITIAVYSKSEAIDNDLIADDIVNQIVEFEERGE